MKGHEDDYRLGVSDVQTEAEKWGCAASERDSSGYLSNVYQYLVGEVKKMQSGSFCDAQKRARGSSSGCGSEQPALSKGVGLQMCRGPFQTQLICDNLIT